MRTLRCALVVTLAFVASAGLAHAATFDIFYEDSHAIDPIVGSGTFSYDGPVMVGSFALTSLTGVAFDATIVGIQLTTADLRTDPSVSGISVFGIAGGQFGLVFTGSGGTVDGGSLDLENSQQYVLTHEPTAAINDRTGLAGGNGTNNLYGLHDVGHYILAYGRYQATAVPEPGTLALCTLGLAGLAVSRRPAR